MRVRSFAAGPGAVLACLLVGGCIQLGGSPDSNFYLLSSAVAADAEPGAEDEGRAIVGVGPVNVPEYLNRNQIVVRRGPNELGLADFHKWVEPVDRGISRVVANNLARLAPVEAISFPWSASRALDFQVILHVARFDTDADGAATLDIRWGLFRQPGREQLLARSDMYRVEGRGLEYADRVATMSEALEVFSRDVSSAVRENLR